VKKDTRIIVVGGHELVDYGLHRMLWQEEDVPVANDYASAEVHSSFLEETVELIISPPPGADAAQLLRLLCQIEEMLNDDYESIRQVAGSWEQGAIIVLKLRTVLLARLLDKLTRLPTIETIRVEQLVKGAFLNLTKKFGVLSRAQNNPSKRIHITLKNTGVDGQEFATSVN